jgi:sugar phosphate isomerase/epimerase
MPSISRQSVTSLPISFATVSVGTPTTPLPHKLQAISTAGFTGIELGFPDLVSFASSYHNKSVSEDDYDKLSKAAEQTKKLCQEKGLEIMMLQPFSNFEGWPFDSPERKDAFERAKGWIKIMHSLGTNMLQVGSTDTPKSKLNISRGYIVNDLRQLADLLAKNGFRMAYENWCWSTHAPTWKDVWEIVKAVDRPNVGLCLDTFQTVGSEFADPTTESGLQSQSSESELETKYTSSLKDLTSQISPEKIYLLQLSDAYKLPTALEPDTQDGEPAQGKELRARGRWSHDYRPYINNGGAYTKQCVEMCKAILATGNRAWFSVEVFDGGKEGKGGKGTGMSEDQKEMESFCKSAMESTKWVIGKCVDTE